MGQDTVQTMAAFVLQIEGDESRAIAKVMFDAKIDRLDMLCLSGSCRNAYFSLSQ